MNDKALATRGEGVQRMLIALMRAALYEVDNLTAVATRLHGGAMAVGLLATCAPETAVRGYALGHVRVGLS